MGLEACCRHLGPVATGAEVCPLTCPQGFEWPGGPHILHPAPGLRCALLLASWLVGLSSCAGMLAMAPRAWLPRIKGLHLCVCFLPYSWGGCYCAYSMPFHRQVRTAGAQFSTRRASSPCGVLCHHPAWRAAVRGAPDSESRGPILATCPVALSRSFAFWPQFPDSLRLS